MKGGWKAKVLTVEDDAFRGASKLLSRRGCCWLVTSAAPRDATGVLQVP
jgi:hypothetical protein